MTKHKHTTGSSNDPLGLSKLETIEPGYDGWNQIEAALRPEPTNQTSVLRTGRWLALAAGLVLVIGLGVRMTQTPAPFETPETKVATPAALIASVPVEDNLNALIGLSQNMEEQVKNLREDNGFMPAEAAVYVAELEDLIAQVDNELSTTPKSINLWGQRINLMIDLAQIYQQQWQTDYGRMASL